ncbi:TonB-dependent receptor [Flavihumibacter sp. ZG627]|uniref:TonB-dependent receptor n=1 Tax=Flavihumibacter sp. ZG627 TaxID=1463156 RepID=UPI00057F3410|nr:TonB-dependent receptor [Flavihumibacter sp. ZG627]KIC89744.1 TonB-dependent receptor [Flavihumibacter sp. ZG627]
MRQLLFLICISILSVSAFAQPPAGRAPGAGMPGAMTGTVYGKITDSDGKPLADVSVVLLQSKKDSASGKPKDILVAGLATKANGDFSFADLPMAGSLKLKISALGFAEQEQSISFGMGGIMKDLGNIKLDRQAQELSGVTVTAAKPLIRMDGEKKIFSVEKDLVSAGGTALDIMKNVPSVQVDIDGNVTMRNAQPTIFLDGRPTTLTLDQIPANSIESVEVISNPSAKYDASGGNAGILNIVLKKNKKTGYNGNLQTGINKYGAITAGGDLSLRQQKFNFSANAMYNQNKGRSTGSTDRFNFAETPVTNIFQDNSGRNDGAFMFGRLGFDYFATNRTTISLGAVKVRGEFNPTEMISTSTDSLYSSGTTNSYSERSTASGRTFNGTGLQLGIKQLFPRDGEEWTADINYFGGKNNGNSLFHTDNFTAKGGAVADFQEQKMLSEGNMNFITLQTDYVRPLKGKAKIETGLRAQLRKTENNIDNYLLDVAANEFVLAPDATSHYKNTDNVYAAYISVSNTIKNFGYQFGLRGESSSYEGELVKSGATFSNKYPISLFPSLSLSQKLNDDQQLQLSYTRRINRPNFFQLIPFTDYSDPLNITRGNSALVPEFTQSLEMSWTKTFTGNHSLLASTYYKYTNNLITRYQDLQYDEVLGKEVLINSFINANNSRSYGMEFTAVNPLSKWWDMTTNLNLYNSKINTDEVQGADQDAMWSLFGKWNNTFKLPKSTSIQLSATYQSKTNLPINQNSGFGPPMMQSQSASQGYISANYGIDIAIKKSFLKNNAASATLSFNDIFGTRKMKQYSYNEFFSQQYLRLRDPQMIRLTFGYRFGKIDATLFKKKNMKGDAMQGVEM